MADVVLRVEDLHKSFDALEVLKGVSMEVERGEVVVIIGASGSGKSTFLRCLNRLEEPNRGRIFLEDVEITDPKTDLPKVRRNIGMIFQQFNLFPHMTAIRNVMEGPLTVLKMSGEEARWHAAQLLDKVGLSDKLDVKPGQLSGGSSRGSRSPARLRWSRR